MPEVWLPNKWKLERELEDEEAKAQELEERRHRWQETFRYGEEMMPTPQQALGAIGMPFAAFEEWVAKPFAATVTYPLYPHEEGAEPFPVRPMEEIIEEYEKPGWEPAWRFEPPVRFPWTPEEERKPWAIGVKGAAEFIPEIPIWVGLGKIGKTGLQRLYKVADRATKKHAAGKPITKAEKEAVGKIAGYEKWAMGRYPNPRLETKLPIDLTLKGPQQRQQVKALEKELVEWLGKPEPVEPKVITQTTLKHSRTDRFMEARAGFAERTYRVERRLESLDGYVASGKYQVIGGKMTQTFWHPINNAKNEELFRSIALQDKLAELHKSLNIVPDKLHKNKTIVDGIEFTGIERIGVYINSLNPQNRAHLVTRNLIPEATVNKIVTGLSRQEKTVGDFMMNVAQSRAKDVAGVYKFTVGKELKLVENYWPIRIIGDEITGVPFKQFIKNERALRAILKWPSARIRKGFVRPRKFKARGGVNLNAYEVFMGHMQGVDHYITHTPVVTQLQRLLAQPELRQAIAQKSNRQVVSVLEKWLAQIAETNPLYAQTYSMEWWMRMFRTNAVTAVLGVNLVTAMKQFPSYLAAGAEIGEVPLLRGLFTSIRHPKQTMAIMKQLAPQIYHRQFEREIAEAQAMRRLSVKIKGGKSWREIFMILTMTTDRIAVNAVWRGAYDAGLRKGMVVKDAAEYATRSIRRTQPFFSVKDIPDFWRSSEAGKMLTVFTNQLNNYWNYYRFDIFGRTKAGQISKVEGLRRMFEAFVMPAMMIGWITRSRPAENVKEVLEDIGSMGFATVPIVGNFIAGGIRGWLGGGVITMEVFERFRELSYNASKEAWDKVALEIPELAGYLVGAPVGQPKRVIKGIIDLAQGKTDDWMELIWGEYARRKAEPKTKGGYKGGYGGGYK